MFYAIDAVDTLFFRNGAPFDAGLNHAASSAFPPLPSVYAGALRTGGCPRTDAIRRPQGESRSASAD